MSLGRIGFIGAGRLGQTLALAMAQAGASVAAVHSRREVSARALATRLALEPSSAEELVARCDTVFLSVADDAIAPVAAALAWREGQLVVHCSGATELTALAPATARGAVAAGFHPLHTFGDVDTALAGLPGCAVAVECADPASLAALQALATALGMRPFELPVGTRALYHASAHYAGSGVVTLMDEAVRHWAYLGVDADVALAALLPLLRSTVRAIESRGLAPGMAGVAARGDVGTLRRHLESLAKVGPQALGFYVDLTRRSVRLALEGGRVDEAQARAMLEALDAAQGTIRP